MGGMGIGGIGTGPPGATAPPAAAPGSPAESTKVTLSAAGREMAAEATQPGASLALSQDASGHHYVNGMDANGFRAPGAVDPLRNVNGQLYAELNKLDELVEAAVLAAILNGGRDKPDTMCILGAAQVVQALNAYAAVSKM
jgi:hypothetical protein